MEGNKGGWVIAVVVIVVAAVAAWWYVAGTVPASAPVSGEQSGGAVTSLPMPVPGSGNVEEMVVAPAAADTVDAIQQDLNAADSGSADFQGEADSLGSDIEKGL